MRLTVHQERSRPAHAESLPRAWHGAIDRVTFSVYRRGARRRIELPGRAVIDFDLERHWAEMCLLDAGDLSAKWFLALRLVCDCLTRGGHTFLHAACLAAPRGGQWQGVVLSAPSNTGKTTTALALAGEGWRLLSDDITYVQPPDFGSAVWGFPRECHLRPGTLNMLAWLNHFPLGEPNGEGVRKLPMSRLGPRSWVDAPWLRPALVAILAAPNKCATRVERIDRAEALNHLGGESISAVPGVCDEDAARDFVTLGRLVCAAPVCRLSVGPDPTDVAEKLGQFIDSHEAVDARQRVPAGLRAA